MKSLLKSSRLRFVAQALILALVTWGIYQSVRKSAVELAAQQADLLRSAEQLEAQARSEVEEPRKQALLREAETIRRSARDFWRAKPAGLLLAGGLYALGMFPAGLYWRRCLSALGQKTELLDTLWAYFLGNLGKYFPGKAMVLVLRIQALRRYAVHKTATTISIFMETLTMMAVGGAVAAISLILLNLDWRLTLLAVGLLAVTFIPTFPPLLRSLIPRLQRGVEQAELEQWMARVSWKLTLRGWFALSITWLLFGLSLLIVLLSIPTAELGQAHFTQLLFSALGACALAVVIGFVSLIPGGAGVREVVLSVVLTPVVGPTAALCAALWMRIVWLGTELSVVAGLALLRMLPRNNARADARALES